MGIVDEPVIDGDVIQAVANIASRTVTIMTNSQRCFMSELISKPFGSGWKVQIGRVTKHDYVTYIKQLCQDAGYLRELINDLLGY